jgi:hypothetical protein
MRHSSQRGVALVVTLLMLSVITFLAVAFLALSRRDRVSVTQSQTQTDARLAAEAGLARAQAEIVARIRAKTNMNAVGLMVSRSYQNRVGFISGRSSPTNVNYNGPFANQQQYLIMLTNLYYDPRVPVFVPTNTGGGALDFRFFVDFNRNGRFETNGLQAELDRNGRPIVINGRTNLTDFVGDPEFIGLLERPQFNHTGTNRFAGRFAYLVVPVGMSLDLNTVHNYAKGVSGRDFSMTSDRFRRHQGVGSYELNFAAFLRDWNTNIYQAGDYSYFTNAGTPNGGIAFADALSLLKYRYGNDARTQPSINALVNANDFGNNALNEFRFNGVDYFAGFPAAIPPASVLNNSWAGSPNTNFLNDVQDMFDASKLGNDFVNRLRSISDDVASYDRYGFYRLLSQVSVDSRPAAKDRINLNYVNDPSKAAFTSGGYSNWLAIDFFTNVASRLIGLYVTNNNTTNFFAGRQIYVRNNAGGDYYNWLPVPPGFGLTNIPVYPTNYYNAEVHRLLQLAANLHDATTTSRYPSVFRPLYYKQGTNLSIVGYTNEIGTNFLRYPAYDLRTMATDNNLVSPGLVADVLAYGQPLVIGAKKGLPNFNEMAMLTRAAAQRKLELRRIRGRGGVTYETNQMLILSVTNEFAIEAWNSYTNDYQGNLALSGRYQSSVSFSNQFGPVSGMLGSPFVNPYLLTTNFTIVSNGWAKTSFVIPFFSGVQFLSNSIYRSDNRLVPLTDLATNHFERGRGFYAPQWLLQVNNRLLFAIVDRDARPVRPDGTTANGAVLDFVSFDNFGLSTNITRGIHDSIDTANPNALASMWDTNRVSGTTDVYPTKGIVNQMAVNVGDLNVNDWNSPNQIREKEKAIDALRRFLGMLPRYNPTNALPPTSDSWKAPYDATATFNAAIVWSANDPLVHYMAGDLRDGGNEYFKLSGDSVSLTNASAIQLTLGKLNNRYQPWDPKLFPGSTESLRDQTAASQSNVPQFDTDYKDSLVRWSDDWDFPTNKLASVGEMGRVHRGTPWQTIFFKAANAAADLDKWSSWSGSRMTHPTNDWLLPDLFTTAPSDLAARGLVSVNQSDAASWSAVLSGVLVRTNNLLRARQNREAKFDTIPIEPASPQILGMVDSINNHRAQLTNQASLFNSAGDILAVPELTIRSPFLNRELDQPKYGITDAAYESIPRQTLSLLHNGDARYLVYTFGQALKPADRSVVNQSGFLNLVTNYQITGEVVTRTLLRVESDSSRPTNNVRIVVEKYDVLPSD